MSELISKSGPLIILLAACGVVALAIFLERFFFFHRCSIHLAEFMQGIGNQVRKRNLTRALHECSATPGPVPRVVRAGLLRAGAPRDQLKEIVRETAQLEVPRLERYLAILAAIAYVAPLIGILGTLLGLVDSFAAISSVAGFATPADIARGVYQALVTSAVGIAVAIFSFLLYSYLTAYLRTLMQDMERAGIETLNLLDEWRTEGQIIAFPEGGDDLAERDLKRESGKGATSGGGSRP